MRSSGSARARTMPGARKQTCRLAVLLAVAALAVCAAAHEHGGEGHASCGQHHPDVAAANLRLMGWRLALLEAEEGPAAAATAAARAAEEWGASVVASAAASDALRALLDAKAASLARAREALAALASRAAAADNGGGGGSGSGSGSGGAGAAQRRLKEAAPSAAPSKAAQPIRIKPVFQFGNATDSAAARRIRGEIIPAALAAIARRVRVRRDASVLPPAGPPFDGRQSCLAELPGAKADPEKDGYDLLLYVTADDARCFPGMIAMSASCDVDVRTGRPTVGSLNICARALASTSGGQVLDTVAHEVVHVLGFSPTHYADWRGPDGKRYARPVVRVNATGGGADGASGGGSGSPQQQQTQGQQQQQQQGQPGPPPKRGAPYLATPRVTAEARRHFGCASAPGAPLETEGFGLSSLAHWEYRLAQHELMTAARPMDRQRAVLSRLTLAALEDSGWYAADYAGAPDLDWGKGAGCDFLLLPCAEFVARHPTQDLYCPPGTEGAARCTAGGRLWGRCRASTFTDGCLIVSREAPTAAGAADDFKSNFQCLPSAGAGGGALVDATTAAVQARVGATGAGPADRCFNLVAPAAATATGAGGGGGGGNSSGTDKAASNATLCVAPVGPGEQGGPQPLGCTRARALCFAAACDAGGQLSVVVPGAAKGGAPVKLACPTGTTLNLAARVTGRFAAGALECPDNARVCRGLACGDCDPAGGYCSLADGRCSCWLERTGPGCTETLLGGANGSGGSGSSGKKPAAAPAPSPSPAAASATATTKG